jgi:hypothetical protein
MKGTPLELDASGFTKESSPEDKKTEEWLRARQGSKGMTICNLSVLFLGFLAWLVYSIYHITFYNQQNNLQQTESILLLVFSVLVPIFLVVCGCPCWCMDSSLKSVDEQYGKDT